MSKHTGSLTVSVYEAVSPERTVLLAGGSGMLLLQAVLWAGRFIPYSKRLGRLLKKSIKSY